MDVVVEPSKEFVKNCTMFLRKCVKPDRREYNKIASKTAIGFAMMGFIGFVVKLVFIPVNQIILS